MQEETLERQYAFRRYMPVEDIPHLAHLLTAVDDHDHDGENTSEVTLHEQLTWPNHHPEQDCWVIEAPGSSHTLIGYGSVFAQTSERCTLYVAIHPAWRRRGLGGVLLTKAFQRAREVGASQVMIYANAHNTAATAFLQKLGFRLMGSAWVLQAPADLALEETSWPTGYRVRSYAEVQQIGVLLEAMNRSYADTWGHAENERATDEAVILGWLANADPGGIFLAFAPDGSIAGFCRAIPALLSQESAGSDHTLTDEIEQPGVVPKHRHRDLYHCLVLTAMHWLRTKGQHAVVLQSWGDDEQTIALYQEMGFLLMQRFLAYQCHLHE